MIIICEECGKKYKINPEKIKGERARVRCKSCAHVITVSRTQTNPPDRTKPTRAENPVVQSRQSLPPEKTIIRKSPPPAEPENQGNATKIVIPKEKVFASGRVGLRMKMFVLFFLIPIVLMALAGALYLRQQENLSGLITRESGKMVKRLAEQLITEKATTVAEQVRLYLDNYPEMECEEYNTDQDFKAIAVQKVGQTGYTALYELPDSQGVWRTWAHVNPKIIGIDMSKLQKPLGRNFHGFWKVYTGVKEKKVSRGYYTWQDKDGSFRDKYMVCTPVKGTRFIIAATTYLDEFTSQIKELENKAAAITNQTRNMNLVILGVTLLLIGLVVSFYGHRLTGKIKSLTILAERISVGELDTEIDIKTKDELGALGEAIARMQESIRLSIERLRRRRQFSS
jgi:predicted Zn finger-like uncharacterized protein